MSSASSSRSRVLPLSTAAGQLMSDMMHTAPGAVAAVGGVTESAVGGPENSLTGASGATATVALGDQSAGEENSQWPSKWQWVILADKDLSEERAKSALIDMSDWIHSSFKKPTKTDNLKKVYLFDSSVVLAEYPFRLTNHYSTLFMGYARLYGGEKVKGDLSTFFTTLGIVSALILTVLSYDMPTYDPETRAAQMERADTVMQVYGSLTGFSSIMSILSIFCSVLLMSKLSQTGEREMLMFIYGFGRFIGFTVVFMILGTLSAYLSINMRLFIAFGPPAWIIVFTFTGTGLVGLFSFFAYANIYVGGVRNTLASVNFTEANNSADHLESELKRAVTLESAQRRHSKIAGRTLSSVKAQQYRLSSVAKEAQPYTSIS